MSNIFDDVRTAVDAARAAQRAVDDNTRQMASLISGRLRAADVPQHILRKLKRELRDYNPHTGKWKPL